MQLQRLFLTFFYLGERSKYPQLLAMIAAMLLGVIILYFMGLETLAMLALAGAIIGVFEINKTLNHQQEQNRQGIVIDKVVGMWLTLVIVQPTAISLGYPYAIAIVLSLLSYWFFDKKKPSTIDWLYHNLKGGLGIITSMLLAAFAAGFLTIVLLRGIHFLFTL